VRQQISVFWLADVTAVVIYVVQASMYVSVFAFYYTVVSSVTALYLQTHNILDVTWA